MRSVAVHGRVLTDRCVRGANFVPRPRYSKVPNSDVLNAKNECRRRLIHELNTHFRGEFDIGLISKQKEAQAYSWRQVREGVGDVRCKRDIGYAGHHRLC